MQLSHVIHFIAYDKNTYFPKGKSHTVRNDGPFYTEKSIECDLTKYNVFLEQHPNQPIRFEGYTFTGNVCFRLTKSVRCFCALVIQLSFPSDFFL